MVSFFFPASFTAELQSREIDYHVCPWGELEVFEGIDHELIDWLKGKASRWYQII